MGFFFRERSPEIDGNAPGKHFLLLARKREFGLGRGDDLRVFFLDLMKDLILALQVMRGQEGDADQEEDEKSSADPKPRPDRFGGRFQGLGFGERSFFKGRGVVIFFYRCRPVTVGANNDFGMIISKLPSSGVSGYELRTDGTTDKPSVVMGMVTGGQKVISGTVAIAQNTWHWWVATYDGTTLRLYVDAAEVASVGVTNDTIASNSLPLGLGMRTPPAITNPLAGRLDDVQIRNTAMTAADIAAEFQRLTRVAFLG